MRLNPRPCFQWTTWGNEASEVLWAAEADLAQEFLATRLPPGQRGLTDEVKAKREEMAGRMKALKRCG